MATLISKDIGLDLGTNNIRVYLKGRGVAINDASVVAFNLRTQEPICFGQEALKMVGKTPHHIRIVKPIEHGIISDFEVTEQMLKLIFGRINPSAFSFLSQPKFIASIPLEVTEVERKSLEDIVAQLGNKNVYLIERPMASAIGNRLPVAEPIGNLVGELGAGLTEIAVISLNGIVASKTLKIGGNTLNQRIIEYVQEKFGVKLGEQTAEEVKIKLINAWPQKPQSMKVKGKNLSNSLPQEINLTDEDVRKATSKTLKTIVEAIKDTIDATPTELVADIYNRGITLSGGSALIPGIDKLIQSEINMPVHIADDPLTASIRGIGFVLEDFKNLKENLIKTK